jgi:hypothetical protein
MKTLTHLLYLTILPVMIVFPLSQAAYSQGHTHDWTDQDFRQAFDEVARNYGAVEYATYTFMVEFARAPYSMQELIDTGHLNVIMTNPYTGEDVISLTPEDFPDGDHAGNIYLTDRDEGHEAHIEAYYVRNGTPPMVHSMLKRIYLYTSSIDHAYFFENDLPRDEQMTAVYCRQAVDALESIQQKIGKSPDDFEDMYIRGDVNVHYVNPVTGELAVSSEELSAGDFSYKKIGDEGYMLIGWGRERPVFFATTDDAESDAFYAEWPELTPESPADM